MFLVSTRNSFSSPLSLISLAPSLTCLSCRPVKALFYHQSNSPISSHSLPFCFKVSRIGVFFVLTRNLFPPTEQSTISLVVAPVHAFILDRFFCFAIQKEAITLLTLRPFLSNIMSLPTCKEMIYILAGVNDDEEKEEYISYLMGGQCYSKTDPTDDGKWTPARVHFKFSF